VGGLERNLAWPGLEQFISLKGKMNPDSVFSLEKVHLRIISAGPETKTPLIKALVQKPYNPRADLPTATDSSSSSTGEMSMSIYGFHCSR
jgi:hypothetical protein